MDEAVKVFNQWAARKEQWQIKTIIPQKKKVFEDGMSFQIVLFPKKFDDFFKKRKVHKVNLSGYLLFESSSLTVKQAEQLNLIMMRLKSKGIQRHLSTMVLIYLIGYYLSDVKTTLFRDEVVKHKIARKIIIDHKDVFVNKKPQFKLDDLLNLWQKEFEIPKFIKMDLIHVYIPPNLDMSLVFDQKWLMELRDYFIQRKENEKKSVSPKLNIKKLQIQYELQPSHGLISIDKSIIKVDGRLKQVINFLKDHNITSPERAMSQGDIVEKANIPTSSSRLDEALRVKGKKPADFDMIFLRVRGLYYLNPQLQILV